MKTPPSTPLFRRFHPIRILPTLLALLVFHTGLLSTSHAQRLTEFLALNTSGAKDEDGTVQPWIEIWNQQQATVTILTNYKLTNGTTTWTIPTIHLMPDERIIIWASGKNRTVVTAPLHTNFTIPDAAGSSLSLLNASNTVVSNFSAYPAQVADVSWGRDDSDTATNPTWVGSYVDPTPGEKNNKYIGGGVAGGVTFSETSRAYNGALTITLSQTVPEEGAVIRYTTTQALPTAASTIYTTPITLSATGSSTVIRARVFKTGKLPGPTSTNAFLRLENNALTFSSAMPIVVISTFGVAPPADGDQNSFMWVWEPAAPDNRARFTNPPVIAARTVVDRRGSSTLDNPKYSLNVETRKQYDDDEEDVSLLGMPEHSDWVLHAPYSFDRSLLHNPLMYAMSNSIGRYAVRNKMAEVFVDTTSLGLNFPGTATGDYFGVYNVMEKIRRGSERVDISKLETYDNDVISKTGGYIFKVDRLDAGDTGFNAAGQTLAYYYPKERDLKSPQRDPQEQFLTTFMNQFNTRLQATTWKDPVLGYATHLDVDAAVDHHLMNVWSFNVDALRLSGYWTKDRNGKVFPGPIWDFDRTLSSTDGRDANPNVWRSQVSDFGTDFFNYTWWNRLFLDPDFYQKYIDRWQVLRAGALSRTNLEALIDSLNAEIAAEAITRDLARWGQFKRSWVRPFTAPENTNMPASQAAEVQRLKDYLRQRANFMDTQWVGPVTASVPAGYTPAGTTVTLTGPAGVPIYYTLDGSDPRPSGGAAPVVAGSVNLYSGPITISATMRLKARAYKSTHTALTGANNPPLVSKWGGVADLTYSTELPVAPGDLVLSEINYHAAAPTPAELAINPAWTKDNFEFLEIRNISGHAITLTGANFDRGITFGFTGGAVRSMAIGESLIIAADPVAFAARYPGVPAVSGPWTGTLSNSSETVSMVTGAGDVLFSVTYMDSWEPDSDGLGKSLVAYQYFPGDVNTAPAWRASSTANGSPGAWDAASLPVSAGPDVTGLITATNLELKGAIAGTTEPGPPVLAWSKVSGPGTVVFATPAAAVTGVTFDLPGTYVVRLSLTVNGVTTTDDAVVRLADTVAAWLARNPSYGTLSDDPDSDGRNNFLEFALNTAATIADGSAPPAAAVQSNVLTLTFQRRRAESGITYKVEISDNLGTFRAANPGELVETITDDDGSFETVRVSDTVPLTVGGRRFLRVKVTSP